MASIFSVVIATREIKMSARTYNPSVRVGNWIEDICLEEDLLKDFLDKKDKGQLTIQKTHNFLNTVLKKVNSKENLNKHMTTQLLFYHRSFMTPIKLAVCTTD